MHRYRQGASIEEIETKCIAKHQNVFGCVEPLVGFKIGDGGCDNRRGWQNEGIEGGADAVGAFDEVFSGTKNVVVIRRAQPFHP